MSDAMRNALAAAGVEIQPSASVTVHSDSALNLLQRVLQEHPDVRVLPRAKERSVQLDLVTADGRILPHSLVLDNRGVWSIKTEVKL